MTPLTVFYDANVLYPADLRNLLMHLALTGLFHAKWSARVQEEWIVSLLRKRPDLTRDKLERTRQLMERAAPNAIVTGYEHLIPGLTLPDPDDRHVLAAAIQAGASIIVTCNLQDFPPEALKPFVLDAQHPDDFILALIQLAPALVLQAAEDHRTSLKNPPRSREEYLATLIQQGLPQTATAIRSLASAPHTPPY